MPARSGPSPFHPGDLARPDAALALRVPYLFHRVGIAVTLVDPHGWHAIHITSNVAAFELEHGVELERVKHNQRCMTEATRSKKAVLGEHRGFTDLFVPVCEGSKVKQMLLAGPFLRTPATAARLIDNWRALTGRYAHLNDPEFARYASQTLCTVVLDGARVDLFCRLIEKVAAIVSGKGQAASLAVQLQEMVARLAEVTFVQRMWDAARAMVDPSTARTWASPQMVDQRAELGLDRVPEHAVVALIAGRNDAADPVEDFVQRDRFQRACAELARERGRAMAGPIGNHGVMFLLAPERREAETQARLARMAGRASELAQGFRFRLHAGTSAGSRSGSLPASYLAALGAAEEALSRGITLVRATGGQQRSSSPLAELRRKLAEVGPRRPFDIAARFERYMEVVGGYAAYRLEIARMYLEFGYERLVEPFMVRGALDSDTASALTKNREEAAGAARSISELFVAYRRAVADLESALRTPNAAHREGNLRRAVAFIHDHLGEPLRLADVARASGFAPNYFSRLFKQREKVTLERYVQRLRVERAQQLLARTTLSVEAVARLCGFASGPYFHRVFKAVTGKTPRDYRVDSATTLRRTVHRAQRRREAAATSPE